MNGEYLLNEVQEVPQVPKVPTVLFSRFRTF